MRDFIFISPAKAPILSKNFYIEKIYIILILYWKRFGQNEEWS